MHTDNGRNFDQVEGTVPGTVVPSSGTRPELKATYWMRTEAAKKELARAAILLFGAPKKNDKFRDALSNKEHRMWQ